MQLQIIAPSLYSIIQGLGLVVCLFYQCILRQFYQRYNDTSPQILDLFWDNSLGMQNKSFGICYSFSQVLQGSLQQSNIPRHAISDDVWNRRVRDKKVGLFVSWFTCTPMVWHMNVKVSAQWWQWLPTKNVDLCFLFGFHLSYFEFHVTHDLWNAVT